MECGERAPEHRRRLVVTARRMALESAGRRFLLDARMTPARSLDEVALTLVRPAFTDCLARPRVGTLGEGRCPQWHRSHANFSTYRASQSWLWAHAESPCAGLQLLLGSPWELWRFKSRSHQPSPSCIDLLDPPAQADASQLVRRHPN